MGLREIEEKIHHVSAFQAKEADLMLKELDKLINDFLSVEKRLKKFEKKYGKKIKNEKEYYRKLSTLRKNLGLPEEIGVYTWKDTPSLSDKLSGKGYFEVLTNDVLEVGYKLVKDSGGLTTLAMLILKVNQVRPGKVVPSKEIIHVLENLKNKGVIHNIRQLEHGPKIVEFTSAELTTDQEKIFLIASQNGYVTFEQVILKYRWTIERTNRILKSLENKGIAIKEENIEEGIKFWFPGFMDNES